LALDADLSYKDVKGNEMDSDLIGLRKVVVPKEIIRIDHVD
jgi:hypothetical protein